MRPFSLCCKVGGPHCLRAHPHAEISHPACSLYCAVLKQYWLLTDAIQSPSPIKAADMRTFDTLPLTPLLFKPFHRNRLLKLKSRNPWLWCCQSWNLGLAKMDRIPRFGIQELQWLLNTDNNTKLTLTSSRSSRLTMPLVRSALTAVPSPSTMCCSRLWPLREFILDPFQLNLISTTKFIDMHHPLHQWTIFCLPQPYPWP